MTATMTPFSTEMLAEKSILQILHLQAQDFRKRFRKKVLQANGGFHSKQKVGNLLKTNF